MFNTIRYLVKSKYYALLAWIRRPRDVETAVGQVISGMESLGIIVVDASVYPKSGKEGTSVGAVVIVAGYIPNKATYFTVKFNYGTYDDYTFTINGQVAEGNWGKINQHGRIFSTVERNPIGSESYGGDCVFHINTYTAYNGMSSKSSKEKVAYGTAFFKKFLDEYGALMASRFTSSVHLWFVPEYSDEYQALVEKNGDYNNANYVGFNTRVMAKFPEGFFCSEQTA